MGRAAWWWGQRKPLAGTLAARYLASRGILEPADGWPDSVAFLPADHVSLNDSNRALKTYPAAGALMVAATDADGAVCGVQRVYLAADGSNARDDAGGKIKRTTGALRDNAAVVRLPGPAGGALLLAEGPETALSVWTATGYATHAAIGNIANHAPPADRRVVCCRDDDPAHSPADKALQRVLARWREAGADVVVAAPWPVRRHDKTDFNDVLQADGPEAVRARIEAVLFPNGKPPTRVTVEEGRAQISAAIGQFFDVAERWGDRHAELPPVHAPAPAEEWDAWQWEEEPPAMPEPPPAIAPEAAPPCHVIVAGVGAGKPRDALQQSAAFLSRLRNAGDRRNVVMAVPMHRLSEEQADRFADILEAAAAGLTARILRGRRAEDPSEPGTAMCKNPSLIDEVSRLKLDVEKRACAICPHGPKQAATCPYLAQRKQTADLWIIAHASLFEAKQKAVGVVAAVVVDESPIAALEGVEHIIGLPLDTLRRQDSLQNDPAGWGGQRLSFLRIAAYDALMAQPDGPIARDALLAFGNLSPAGAGEAFQLEWQTLVDVELHPGMTPEQRTAALRLAEHNADMGRRAMMWRSLAALLRDDGPAVSGRLAMMTSDPDKRGEVHRSVVLHGCRQPSKGWTAPTLCMDATGSIGMLQHIWPGAFMAADVQLQAPHQRVWQAADAAYSLSKLVWRGSDDSYAKVRPGDGAAWSEGEQAHRGRNLDKLHATLHRIARAYAPGRVLVVVQKAVSVALGNLPPLPSNVERDPATGLVPWHNSLRGIDRYGTVRALVVVGRTLPPSDAASRAAGALTGCAVPTAGYEITPAARETRDGRMIPAETRRHPDPLAEEWRWQACEAEVVQIIGRGRGVNRTADNPLDVLVMTDVVLPLPVELIPASHINPTLDDRMVAAGGIAWRTGSHAAAALPGWWSNPRAADKAFEREKADPERFATFPYINTSYTRMSQSSVGCGDPPGLARVEYQLAGAGKRPAVAWVYPEAVPDPAMALAERLGPLAWCRVSAPAQPARPSPSIPSYKEIRTMTDADKLAMRARLQGGVVAADCAAPLVLDGHGDALPVAGLIPEDGSQETPDGMFSIRTALSWAAIENYANFGALAVLLRKAVALAGRPRTRDGSRYAPRRLQWHRPTHADGPPVMAEAAARSSLTVSCRSVALSVGIVLAHELSVLRAAEIALPLKVVDVRARVHPHHLIAWAAQPGWRRVNRGLRVSKPDR